MNLRTGPKLGETIWHRSSQSLGGHSLSTFSSFLGLHFTSLPVFALMRESPTASRFRFRVLRSKHRSGKTAQRCTCDGYGRLIQCQPKSLSETKSSSQEPLCTLTHDKDDRFISIIGWEPVP